MGYESHIRQARNMVDNWEEKALDAIGMFIDGEAVLRCPVGQYQFGMVGGNLRSSLTYVVNPRKHMVTNGTPVEYAIYVEKGTGLYAENGQGRKTPWVYQDSAGNWHRTSGMRAQPFLTPAVEENLDKIQMIVKAVKFGGIG